MSFSLRDEVSERDDNSGYAYRHARTLFPLENDRPCGAVNSQERIHSASRVIYALGAIVMNGDVSDIAAIAPCESRSGARGCSASLTHNIDDDLLVFRSARIFIGDEDAIQTSLVRLLEVDSGLVHLKVVTVPGDTRSVLRIVLTEEFIDAVGESYEKANTYPPNDPASSTVKSPNKPAVMVTVGLTAVFLLALCVAQYLF